MNKLKTLAAAATVAATCAATFAGTGQAHAADGRVWIWNHTPGAIWVTIYRVVGQQQKKDWFCVPADQMKQSKYNFQSWPFIYIRAEVKYEKDGCGNPKNAYDSKNNHMNVETNGRAMMTFTSSKVTDKPSTSKAWK
ncbi:MAG: hypothetical protein Q7T81_15060 [Pseudolabrys sp.]|nr:hypothetical protein [Pseudolabrys sp.]